ncbi:MAG TPA: TIM barrel protein [Pirellulaceae bacterium]|nr:TIM barrel protein [Pirellulaceae bacterium]
MYDPHVSIDISEDGLKRLVDQIAGYGLSVGSVVAPIWFEGNAMGNDVQVQGFLTAVRKACQIAARLRDMGIRKYGVVRIDSACGPADWQQNPLDNQKRIAETFRKAGEIAQDFDERLAAEGEICWGGMHSWRDMVNLLELVDMRDTVGFQADLAHTYLYLLGYNAAEHRLLPENYSDEQFWQAYETLTQALRPWTIDFHVAQNDGTVKGSGSHDKTGRHCPATDPNGKLDIVKCSGYWLQGAAERGIQHLCWDGCMFPNAVLENKQTYNDILRVMMQVRDQHGW